MPRAKKQTQDEKLQKGLQEIEERLETLFRSQVESLTKDVLRDEVKKEVNTAFDSRKHADSLKANAEVTRSQLRLSADKDYRFTAEIDGLVLSEVLDDTKGDVKPILNASSNGALAFGFKAPRTVGYGSAHFRANYPSEAPIPSSGLHSTRGVIVEGDGDDEKTFTFRALSRQNRQGFNITGDGSVLVGDVSDKTLSRVHINQPNNDENVLNLFAGSKIFENTFINIQSGTPANDDFKFLCTSVLVEQNGNAGLEVFKVSGRGGVYTEQGIFCNDTGYAELFEWADKNKNSEDRNGFTVSLDSTGKIVPAGEGDTVIGVVCQSAAVVGNAGWNAWTNRFKVDNNGNKKQLRKKVVEWIDHVGVLQSYYIDQLNKDFALPDNAIIYESNGEGDDIFIEHTDTTWDINEEYIPRIDRGWALVALTGRVNVFKGQNMDSRWIKYCDLNDNVETWILK